MVAALAVAAAPDDDTVRELGREWLVMNDGIGLSVGVYDNGQQHFFNFGATRLDGNRTPTENTVYEIGSISKTLTGQLLARAIVEGRAGVDDDVDKYLDEDYPNLQNGGERVRLLHLANMTSQLVDNIPDLTQLRAVAGEPIAVTRQRVIEQYTRTEFLRQLHRVMPRLPPGGNPAHSNVPSALLGVALEKIYGAPFEAILAREIEKPLKMRSGVAPDVKALAQGYDSHNTAMPPFTAPTQYASGSLRYGTQDLLRYAAWQMVERDASVKLAHQPTWHTPDRRQAVAFYWIVEESPLGRRLYFSGETNGFASYVDLYPDARLALVVLANKAADGAQESLRALSAKVAGTFRPASPISPPSSTDVPPPDR